MTVFTLTSDKLRVTDPCYERGTWCAGVLNNVLTGKWIAEKLVISHEETGWGDRIGQLQIWHEGYIDHVTASELTDISVGVDSGQAGFFDESQYPEGETGEYMDLNTFYGKVCAGTAGEYRQTEEKVWPDELVAEYEQMFKESGKWSDEIAARVEDMKTKTRINSEPDYLGIANVGFGVATRSGFGDGGYQCYVGRNAVGQIVAARIVFITDEDLVEDLDEEEDDE